MFGSLSNFFGGPPLTVLLKLVVVSFVAGLLMQTFGFDPSSLFHQVVRGVRRLIDYGFSDLRHVADILLTGAMVVIPVWIVLRLIEAARTR